MIKHGTQHPLRNIQIKKSLALTGINLYFPNNQTIDEVEAENLLIKWQKKKIIKPQFKMPWKFMTFREPITPYCDYPP